MKPCGFLHGGHGQESVENKKTVEDVMEQIGKM